MVYKALGRTGLKVSAVGLGCGGFGGVGSAPALFGQGETVQEAAAIMDAAWEMGIILFDTADAYGGGRSEQYIGAWLRTKGPRVRHDLVLGSKVFNSVGEGPNDRGLSHLHILRQIERTLRHLNTDYLDLYMTHGQDPDTSIDETLRAFDDLVHQGKVRYIGASNMPASLMTQAVWTSRRLGTQSFEWVQNSYSLLDRYDEHEMLPLCGDLQLGYMPFSPLAGGWLTGKYASLQAYPAGSRMTLRPEAYAGYERAETFAGLARLRAEAKRRGVSMAGLALAWVLSHPLVTAPIIGPRRPEHLQPVREALQISLAPDERETIAGFFA